MREAGQEGSPLEEQIEDEASPSAAAEETNSISPPEEPEESQKGLKEERVTRLIIEKDGEVSGHTIRDQEVDGRPVTLGRHYPEGSVSYYKIHNLSNTQKLEVFMREGNELRKIELPEDMLERMAEYIKVEHKFKNILDCFCFACIANDTPTKSYDDLQNEWDMTKPSESELKPGDTIVILDDGKFHASRPTHFAIYLGDDLYISKAGFEGRLMVADIDEMVDCFGGKYVSKITPKKA